MSIINDLVERVEQLEASAIESVDVIKNTLLTEDVKRKKYTVTPQVYYGLYTAICIDTQDPLKQNRVRFYSPLLNDQDSTQVDQLDWAWPCSSMGGFDDSGLSWVPPAGSLLVIGFERGNRSTAYYLGTTWTRNRGKGPQDNSVGQYNFGYQIPEFDKIHAGHRKGYLIGKDDESQVLPPWNTESMNGCDADLIDSTQGTCPDAIAQKNITYPNIYGYKTPQKIGMKHVDGDPNCNYRWKRSEWFTPFNWMIMKDDMLNPGGQWAHPDCGCGGGDVSECPQETPGENCTNPSGKPKCANPYYKQKSECRPYSGPGTPQNNKCALDQGGIQILDMGGNTIILDASVEQPTIGNGVPWERGLDPFDFGCSNKYTGKMKFISATGHRIELNDEEEIPEFRGPNNGVRLISASGNYLFLCDDTDGGGIATSNRGWWAGSTSGHVIQMCDDQNDFSSPARQEIGKPEDEATDTVKLTQGQYNRADPNATQAYIRMRSGYGLTFFMGDAYDQQKTDQQFIEILSPQITNTERGPHILRFDEAPTGPGQFGLRVGGNYWCATYDNHVTEVGVGANPSNKVTMVTGSTFVDTQYAYINVAEQHVFIADEAIYLLAGKDCPNDKGQLEPCMFPVLVYQPGQGEDPGTIVISDRVYASASPTATVASIFAMNPFVW